MHKTNVPIKVAIGYGAVAIVLMLAITLVYSNTKSILAINQASREYIQKRDAADSTMSSLLQDEQENLRQLSDAMQGKGHVSYLQEKVKSLNNGQDSIVVHPKTTMTHEAKNTTVEVVKTRKGFFRRLADAFKKEHAETLSVKRDTNQAVIDSVTAPVNVAENVADILSQIDQKEKSASKNHSQAVSKEMAELQMVNAQLALRSAQQLSDVHRQERESMQQAINKAMEARQHLLWQIGLLAIVAVLAAIILLWYIWRDTKKERIYRENLENANEEIQRIMNQRERLLLTITHDIKAPAASISGFIDLMRDYVKDPQGIDCLQSIKGSADHLSQLVASLLDYHQLENGLLEIHPVDFSPALLVKQCAEGQQIRAEQKGLQITYELKEGVDATYLSDAFRIRQILDNLVSNAVKYTGHGSVHVTASITPRKVSYTQHPGDFYLTLTVKDTGKGMTSEECQKVFQAFTRLKSAQGIEGTGLGLSITQELVSLLGGEIRLRSEVGKGSTFIVTIPLERGTAPKEENKDEKTAIAANHKVSQHKLLNHKILLLDDDKLQLQLLQEMLHRLVDDSWQIIACNHVTEALTALHNEQPSLMLMDIEMPEMNGMDMIRHINHSGMVIIAMTAHDLSIKSQLLQAGFDDCLFKPFHLEDLSRLLGIENKPDTLNSKKQVTHSRFQPLLTFAEGDAEAETEILKTVKTEIEGYRDGLKKELEGTLDLENIGKIAHKLLPLATMLQMQCIEPLKALAPEHIKEQDSANTRKNMLNILKELSKVLEEISVPKF